MIFQITRRGEKRLNRNGTTAMNDARHAIIDAHRQKKPIPELRKKWEKARGRHSKRYYCQEWIDLAYARAEVWANYFKGTG
jgi:hypothetical protein